MAAFQDHGTVARTVDKGVEEAEAHLGRLEDAGVDMADVGRVLEEEGVASFSKSFDELISALERKSAELEAS